MQEKELLKKCRKNDRKAQRRLYDLYKNRLMGVCVRYAGSYQEAEDIFQDAFIKVFNNLHKLENDDILPFWIRKTVIRTAIDHYHKQKKYLRHVDTEDVAVENEDYSRLLAQLDAETLLQIINALPDGYRMVFNLQVVDGFSHKEIAEMLGITESTSRTQLHKAKALIKQKLAMIGIKKYEKYG